MSVTLTIDEALLREAEKATNIHDWPTLVITGLKGLAHSSPAPGDVQNSHETAPPSTVGARTGPWTDEDFDQTLVAAAALPDLTDEEFDQFEKEMNLPLPPPWSECD